MTACTTSHEIYTGEEEDEFSTLNTILLPVAIAGVVIVIAGVAAAAGNGGGSSYQSDTVSCNGSYCNNNAAWDYLPGSAQYRCRSTYNGQFVDSSFCAYQLKQDNWY